MRRNFRNRMKWKRARRIAFQGQKSVNFHRVAGRYDKIEIL